MSDSVHVSTPMGLELLLSSSVKITVTIIYVINGVISFIQLCIQSSTVAEHEMAKRFLDTINYFI